MLEEWTSPRAEGPIDTDLWDLTRDAVRALSAVADEHLARGGYCARVALPVVDAYESGWPRLTRVIGSEHGPPIRSSLFAQEARALTPFAYGDVPKLAGLLAWVEARDDLRQRLAYDAECFPIDWMVTHEAAALPLSLLDRVHALDAHDDDALLALYLHRERAWLADPLTVDYLFPLALTALDLDEPLLLDDRTRIQPLDAKIQAARVPLYGTSVSGVPVPVAEAATHAVVVRREIDNPGPGPRNWNVKLRTVAPLDEADRVCEALRIATNGHAGYAQVLSQPVGWADQWTHDLPAVTELGSVRRYPESFDAGRWLRPGRPATRAALERLPTVLASLRTATPRLKLASRRLSLAQLRGDRDDQTVDACIGLEALLSSGRDELSHRLSQRAAAALSSHPTDPWKASFVYAAMRHIYKHRSAVVHGDPVADKIATFPLGDRRAPNGKLACDILRRLLLTNSSTPADGHQHHSTTSWSRSSTHGLETLSPDQCDRRSATALPTSAGQHGAHGRLLRHRARRPGRGPARRRRWSR